MQLNNDLWAFALKFYQQPGVEQACLQLQDQYGVSINRLLYACWCSVAGVRLPQHSRFVEVEHWQQQVTHKVRSARYTVRKQKAEQSAMNACYDKLRAAELACEQIELAMLHSLVIECDQEPVTLTLLEENLQNCLKIQNLPIDTEIWEALSPLREQAITYFSTDS